MRNICFLFLLLISFGCQTSIKPEAIKKFRNNIHFTAEGIKVEQAYLTYADGSLVPESNLAKINDKIVLHLIMTKGWKEENGMVSLDASQRLESNTHEILLDETSMFKTVGEVSSEDAKIITLSIKLGGFNKLYDYFILTFRLWDIRGSSEVHGNYKINLTDK